MHTNQVVILTMHKDMGLMKEAKKFGAIAFLSKSTNPTKLRATVLSAAAGRRSFPRSLGGEQGLSSREREVLSRIAAGDDSRAIAAKLGLAIRTIEKHRENLTGKLKVKGAAALPKYALIYGLTNFDDLPV